MIKKTLLFMLCVMFGTTLFAQYSICGTVVMDGEKQENASITIAETYQTIKANDKGNFCFAGIEGGEYSIYAVNAGGFISPMVKVLVNEDITGLKIDISDNMLDVIEITGRVSQAGIRKNHSIKTEVVDLSKQVRSSVSVEQMMNRSAGIRIRNTGGLGAEADVIVGGFNGKSIKFLIDGIPVDYLGSSMGLTKIPSSVADYIEVYKGVMPTEIGIDALGGAINIVQKKPDKNIHRMSYAIGSFNTHKVSLNTYYKVSDHISYGFNGFGNYSDNDFKVDNLPLVDPETGRTESIRARLFNNGYKQYSADGYINFEDYSWADLLKIKLNSYAIKRELQNDFSSRSRPFGEVFRREHAYLVPSIEYKKSFLDEKLKTSQFLVYSSIKNELADTLKNAKYDWLGNKYPAQSGSEMGSVSEFDKPIVETRTDNFTYRGLFTYRFNNRHKLILNAVNTYLQRTSDNLYDRKEKTNVDYNRFIGGLGYQYNLFDNRFEGLTQVKYLVSSTSGKEFNEITQEVERPTDNTGLSFAQSFKYNFYNGLMLRASVENTFRLPDQNEIFGDNTFINPNLSLKPEKSTNLNLGLRYRKSNQYSFEVNSYYRNTKDLIRLKDITQFTSVFLNLDKVKGFGVELEASYQPIEQLELSGNLTYNEFRFQGTNGNISENQHFKNARVSNMPFYFGNAMATYYLDDLFAKDDHLQLYWSYSYVHQYYLDFIEKQYEPDGFLGLYGHSKINTNRVIPIQQVHAAGFVWSTPIDERRKISFSAELDNIFNEPIFNAFKMQSPGRNFSAKVTYDF
ncbi:MAG TPA: TonB-dependent receptor [Flavobacteriaceae bacterium]|nr:TonB-dependent receptor [Flavobacteriaceae bacterium]